MIPKHAATMILPLALLVLAVMVSGPGCDRDPLVKPHASNSLPDTRVGGHTPEVLETGFMIRLHWDGADSDGEIVGFQWKLCPVGSDGITASDTMTVDPNDGSLLHPWHFTTNPESLYVVTAPPEPADKRFTEAYVFLVRAMDSDHGVDPTPAYITFTASTLLPNITVVEPAFGSYLDAQPMPPTVRFSFEAIDPDGTTGEPIQWRYLWQRALYDTDEPPYYDDYINSAFQFSQHLEEVASFADSNWSLWMPYPDLPENRVITFPNQSRFDVHDRLIYYIFVLQAMDETGAVSVNRLYADNVHNVFITDGLTPTLLVNEYYLGNQTAVGLNTQVQYDIATGQPLNFSWVASAEGYNGTIVAYQYGWDVTDPDDPNDPGWALPPGNSPNHRSAPEQTFSSGIHTLTIQCWDDFDQMTRIVYALTVVPIPSPELQLPLLLVDDVKDQTSNGWEDSNGTPLDYDQYRDLFWEGVLTGSGGVAGFVWSRDAVDTEDDPLAFRDLVDYRAVLWTTRFAVGNFIWDNFQPYPDGHQPYNWLDTYQQYAGNVFMAGSRAMNTFLEEVQWMVPWVFDTEEYTMDCGGQSYYTGFGTTTLPDGTEVLSGPLRYPYQSLGIAMLDHVTPRYNIYGECGAGSVGDAARAKTCVGVKGLLLDTDFQSQYMTSIEDTILTDTSIDWKDQIQAYADSLKPYTWGSDEFYDGNIADRPTLWSPQDCDGEPCLEPMFRMYSRFDWVDDVNEAAGNPAWPHDIFDPGELTAVCGQHALDSGGDESLTTSQITGFVSHKYLDTKPSGVGDVMWGFDPYRFNHEEITKAIQWVLGDHFGLVIMP